MRKSFTLWRWAHIFLLTSCLLVFLIRVYDNFHFRLLKSWNPHRRTVFSQSFCRVTQDKSLVSDSRLFCWLLHDMSSRRLVTGRELNDQSIEPVLGSGSMNSEQLIKQRMFMSCFRLLPTKSDTIRSNEMKNIFDEPQMSLKLKLKSKTFN